MGREVGVARASVLMASGTMVSRVLGLVRTTLLVACLGTAEASNAFNTANTLPNNIYALLSGGLLTAVLIPQITKAMERPDDGPEVVDRLITLCLLAILAVALAATVLAWPLCWLFGLRGPALTLGTAFAWICLPQIFFYGAYALLGQVLNVQGSFATDMWSPVLANLVQIAGLALFLTQYRSHHDVTGWSPGMVWCIAGTSTLGIALQAAVLLPALRHTGFHWHPRRGFRGYGFRAASRMAGWAFAALALSQLGGWASTTVMNLAAGRAAAHHQQVAGVTIYQLAFMFFMLPQSVITTSILTALYPRMARAAVEHDTNALRHDLEQGLTSPSLLLVPITVAGLALAQPGIGLLQPSVHGQALHDTVIAFSLMLIGLVPFGWNVLQQRYLFAIEDGRTNLWLQGLLVGTQVVCALLALGLPARHTVAVIAAGQTLGNTASVAVFLILTQHRLGGLPLRRITRTHAHLIAVSLAAGTAAWATSHTTAHAMGPGYLTMAAQLAVGGAAFTAALLGLAHTTGLTQIITQLRRLAHR